MAQAGHPQAAEIARKEINLLLGLAEQAGSMMPGCGRPSPVGERIAGMAWRSADRTPLPARPALPMVLRHLGYLISRLIARRDQHTHSRGNRVPLPLPAMCRCLILRAIGFLVIARSEATRQSPSRLRRTGIASISLAMTERRTTHTGSPDCPAPIPPSPAALRTAGEPVSLSCSS
jgi:hypothetical protein